MSEKIKKEHSQKVYNNLSDEDRVERDDSKKRKVRSYTFNRHGEIVFQDTPEYPAYWDSIRHNE
ncbi:MAG: hypothetical protein PHS79_04415 [Patescibacteria group bacterium]|nr:hypothetical protein [Patescibacteria group bacterium]